MYVGLHVWYPLLLSDFDKVSQKIFKKYSNTKFHENMSSGIRVVLLGRTDGWAHMTKLVVAFYSFAEEPWQMCDLSRHSLQQVQE